MLADLDRDAERLAQLADALLALSREEAASRPSTVVRLDLLAQEAAQLDELVDVVATEPIAVQGDARALERALANLVQNARVHGPADGKIVVRADRAGDLAELSVTDEGSGLRPEEARLAFQRFWRRSSERPGSGLGLAIVRATAERHGGRAYAEASRFAIELPALRDLSGSVARTEADPEKGSS